MRSDHLNKHMKIHTQQQNNQAQIQQQQLNQDQQNKESIKLEN
jgi:hypothetical protein